MINWEEYHNQQKVHEMGETFLSYREYGDRSNETIICLHGIPTWGYIYEDLASMLSENYHVLVPDLLGYGFSDKRDNFDRAIDKQAAYIIQFMNDLGIEEATLIGHDIGGGVAQRMATTFGDKFKGLCLMNSVCYDSWPIEVIIQLGHPALKKVSPKYIVGFLNQALKQGFDQSSSKELREGMLAPWNSEEGHISLIRNASSLNTNHTTEIAPLLRKLEIPTLLLWGIKDKFQRVSYGKMLEENIPNAKLVEVKDASHWVMLDQPFFVFEELKKFLEARGSYHQGQKDHLRPSEFRSTPLS